MTLINDLSYSGLCMVSYMSFPPFVHSVNTSWLQITSHSEDKWYGNVRQRIEWICPKVPVQQKNNNKWDDSWWVAITLYSFAPQNLRLIISDYLGGYIPLVPITDIYHSSTASINTHTTLSLQVVCEMFY